jgi:hypothetical protein
MQRSVRILLAGLVPLLIIVLHPVMRHLHAQERRCFAETVYCIEGRVLNFWEQHGGLAIFGYPLTSERWDVIEGTSLRVQWFERVRIEFQPQADAPSDIQLGRLGSEVLARTGHDWRDFSHGPARGTCRFFPETGYQVCDDFLTFWSSHGVQQDDAPEISPQESLALFGLPLGNEQTSTLNDGRVIIVQWFERARLERFLDRQAGTVHLGLLGRENLLVRTHNVIPIPTNTVRPSEFWVTMPDLVGLEKNVARSQLRQRGIEPIIDLQQGDCEVNQVLSTLPQAGRPISSYPLVTLGVCSPPIMPELIGKQQTEAVALLRQMGIDPDIEETGDSRYPEGEVWATFPAAGTPIEPGTTVLLRVIVHREHGEQREEPGVARPTSIIPYPTPTLIPYPLPSTPTATPTPTLIPYPLPSTPTATPTPTPIPYPLPSTPTTTPTPLP